MSQGKSSGGGCVAIVVILFAISLVMWAIAIALWVLGLVVLVGGVAGSGFLAYRGWCRVGRGKEMGEIKAEIAAMARDCATDLGNLQLELATIATTKGIGTHFEEELCTSNRVIDDLNAQCEAAILMCNRAPGVEQQLEAIAHAEQVRQKIRRQIG